MFSIYLQLGFEHLVDIKAYDHLLFLVALCAVYRLEEWKKVLILVTAFTIGHSLTLALAVLDWISFSQPLVETLIPITILITCFYNIVKTRISPTSDHTRLRKSLNINYLFALFFGLIHGMGFSGFLKSTLMPGQEQQLFTQLLAFNLGIELGQLLIVGLILLVTYVAINLLGIAQRWWALAISIIVGIMAIQLMW